MRTVLVQRLIAARPAGCPRKEVEVVLLGISQCPEVAGGGQEEVQAVESDVAGEHRDRGDDPGAYVALVFANCQGQQSEEPLGVRLALHQHSTRTPKEGFRSTSGKKTLDQRTFTDYRRTNIIMRDKHYG